MEYKSNSDENQLITRWISYKIKPYLRTIIIDLQNSDTWKIQLTIAINFIPSRDTEEEHVMHSNSDSIKFTSYNDANEVLNDLFWVTSFKNSR